MFITEFCVLVVKVWPLLELVVVGHEDVEEAQDGQHLEDGLHGQAQEVGQLQHDEAHVVENVLKTKVKP